MKLNDVSIAALLGSVDAVRGFLAGIPRDFPIPILCMPRDDDGIRLMTDLSFITPLETCWAQSGVKPRRGTVYVAPPKMGLVVKADRKLGLTGAADISSSGTADQFLQSLARTYRDATLVVALGDSSLDAAGGAASVKAAGGTLIIDDGAQRALYPLPVQADHVLSPKEAAAMLARMAAGLPFTVPQELAAELTSLLRDATGVWSTHLGNVQLLDPKASALRIVAHQGFHEPFLEHFRVVSAEDGAACGRALREGKRIMVEDVDLDPGFAPHRAVVAAAGYRAVQSTPILGRGRRFLGVLSTHAASPRSLSAAEADAFNECAARAAGQIEAYV